ncbi:sigma-54 dependent transcriptional regulator [Rhodovulum sulfidophilum]|uniref:sigma-54-dependent transcriptional regulator n=1 Tax=Rhodovulum sulfidophilum TaxID=35806 RepID=UPI00192325A9|nr:sigma-54 dependent transcriptional regulator [Rhodovulum sulfidophilum]MBL3574121.1 sigma-54-dependent Fis family transcriptional regulator [Rhodovulum sulfidophilum]MCE8433165.1 sigma-54 dependent transcriptional regulator [Rhodovulum sulfidophilum]MCF4117477.1 sigma-54 dependent transcriptional regulator [Rhodovulum sulfidophilum]
MSAPPLLLIEDTPSLQMIYETVLRNAGYKVVSASTAAEGLAAFRELKPQVVLLDLMLPDRPGQELLQEFLSLAPETRVIVVTANGSINRAVEAMRAGAYEFLLKPFNEQRFLHAVETALAERAAADPAPAPAPPRTTPEPPSGFVGSSPQMAAVYDRIASVGRSKATVFITGESGTGKEICAQAVHAASARADGPFVPMNCAAIPRDLLESEVFGHLKGAFTGALADKPGAAAVADGGTLFLDEICEMDMGLQTKLLRFLQTSTVQPIGASHPRKVNVRIVCATNRDPLEEVRLGRFREDLYYRLHVVPIHLPPLRERGEDVVEIAQSALEKLSAEEEHNFDRLAPEVADLFRRLPWPGNVRQLLNVLRHAVVLNQGPEITLDMLPIALQQEHDRITASGHRLPEDIGGAAKPIQIEDLIGRTLAEIEQMVIEGTIAREGGSLPRAARVLDVSPSTLYRKREAWARKDRDDPADEPEKDLHATH